MTLDKAIEIVGDIIRYQYSAFPTDEGDAIKISFEALKERRKLRNQYPHLPWQKLPGED